MRKKVSSESSQSARSMRTFVIFCLVVGLLIMASLAIKITSTLKNSTFDGEHRYTLLVTHTDRKAQILSFEPKSKTITWVSLDTKDKIQSPGKMLGIPIDGKIVDKDPLTAKDEIPGRLLAYSAKLQKSDITEFDLLRLFIFAQNVSAHDIAEQKITTTSINDELEASLAELFYDQSLQDEKVPIAIVNASGVTGRGTALERILVKMGANVVQVTTAPKEETHSKIHFTDKGIYTTKRVLRLLKYPGQESEGDGLSDIIITIGKDSISHPVF